MRLRSLLPIVLCVLLWPPAFSSAQPGIVGHVNTTFEIQQFGLVVAVDSTTERVYVLTRDLDTLPVVTVIDGTAGTEVARIPLGDLFDDPDALALNEVTRRLYVASDERVTVVDTDTGEIVATVATDLRNANLAVDAVLNRVYVSGERGPTVPVLVIDGAASEVVEEFSSGTAALMMRVDPATHVLYVAGHYAVEALDGITGASIASIPSDVSAQGAALDSAGQRLYLVGMTFSDEPVLVAIDTETSAVVGQMPLPLQVIKGMGLSVDLSRAFVAGLHSEFDSTALVVIDLATRSTLKAFGSDTEAVGLEVSRVTGRVYLPGMARVTALSRVTIMHEDAASEPSGNTPVGENVTVEPVDPNTGLALVTITFSEVQVSGDTFAYVMPGITPQPPGYRPGTPPLTVQVSTTARYGGPVSMCLPWQEGQFEQESTIRVMRWENGNWADRTLSRDEVANRICARADTLEYSTFLVVEAGFQFAGFLAPVEPVPVRNVVKVGSALPIRFSLGGYQGVDIFREGSPISWQMQCDTLAPIAVFTATASAGQSGLSYDSQTDIYTYVWKTEKGWANSCRRFVITLSDGSVASAYFSFSR